ncbi:MAG: ATPase, T2SS/T4P/T4SS family [bacterium]|nr:ATPase, T2SS/T4P/T4SS family [bacterium]
MATVRKSLGEYLVERGYVTREQLEQAQKIQRSSGGDLGRILVDNQWATMAQVAEARAQELGVPYVDLNTTTIDPSAVNVVPERIARQHKVVPILKDGNVLHVAMADINNVLAFDDLRLVSRCTIRPVLAAPDAIEEAINRAYQSVVGKPAEQEAPAAASAGGGIMQMIKMDIAQVGVGVDVDEEDVESAVRVAEEAPIVRIANTLIQQAIKERASDIHVEPQERGLRIRYRIDGVLHEIMTLPKYIQAPLISRYKIMAEMNIAERRLPQDGRIPVRVEGKDYDLRVSSIPVHLSSGMGEKIVMRILDKTSILIGLDKLGFTPEVQAQLEELVVQPNGMVLSTGPTGSGKTTTQYSVLHKLNSIEKNIITIEDPVEYQLPGISQVQVNRKAGLSFANALRSFLRQERRPLCGHPYDRDGRRALPDFGDGHRRTGSAPSAPPVPAL